MGFLSTVIKSMAIKKEFIVGAMSFYEMYKKKDTSKKLEKKQTMDLGESEKSIAELLEKTREIHSFMFGDRKTKTYEKIENEGNKYSFFFFGITTKMTTQKYMIKVLILIPLKKTRIKCSKKKIRRWHQKKVSKWPRIQEN